jgi:hypothetical protein
MILGITLTKKIEIIDDLGPHPSFVASLFLSHYEKLCPPKPHYLTLKHKNN